MNPTPADIAAGVYWTLADFPEAPTGKDLRDLMTKAVEADRAQLLGSVEIARDAINATYQAAEGYSNDEEIESLQEVRDYFEGIVVSVGGAWDFEPTEEDED